MALIFPKTYTPIDGLTQRLGETVKISETDIIKENSQAAQYLTSFKLYTCPQEQDTESE